MTRGLFVNTKKEICSIYESGISVYNNLKDSNEFKIDYVEIDKKNRKISNTYDFYLFNYHWVKMGWLNTRMLKKIHQKKFCLVLETFPQSPLRAVSHLHFDAYLVLDPLERSVYSNVHFFPRPILGNLEKSSNQQPISGRVRIGSYGLALNGKGFDRLVGAVNKEFDEAEISLHLPTFSKSSEITKEIFLETLSKKNVKNFNINISSQNTTHEELVKWCYGNDINVFLYTRNIGTGLSATTDQAIESGKPLLISTNATFRHLHPYITPYPFQSIKQAIASTKDAVNEIRKDWNKVKFVSDFVELLKIYKVM
jgi:6-pyruvoyl-tetrahydropterin synthase